MVEAIGVKTEPKSEYDVTLKRLNHATDGLSEVICRLQEKVNPSLRLATPEPTAEEVGERTKSIIENRLEDVICVVETFISRINDITDRCCL